MMMPPTPYPDVNAILSELQTHMQRILGPHLVALYLDGSLANGDFDESSDIDFVAVTDEDISAETFETLRLMHAQMNAGPSPWAIQLEGTYLSAQALRRYDPTHARHPNIERGLGEALKWVQHGPWWLPHLAIVREKGIVLLGLPPHTLIDPVSPNALRSAMRDTLAEWGRAAPGPINSRGYQSYIVLTLCRVLYTLQHGRVVSKKIAAQWAQTSLDKAWAGLIERAWEGRLNYNAQLDPNDVVQTLKMVAHFTTGAQHEIKSQQ